MTDNNNKIPISDIKVGPRFRKDLGDIAAFAETIQKTEGLLQPIGITKDNELACGQRRLKAYELLGYTEVPFYIVPTKDILLAELYENDGRKDFTVSERVAILEEVERQRIGHRIGVGKGAKLAPFQKEQKGKKSRDIVAQYTNVKPSRLQMEKKLVYAARDNPGKFDRLLKSVESERTSLIFAYKMVVRDEDKRRRVEELKASLESYAPISNEGLLGKIRRGEYGRYEFIEIEKNENEYRSEDGDIRLIQGGFISVSRQERQVAVNYKETENPRCTSWNWLDVKRDGIPDHSVDLIYIDTNAKTLLDGFDRVSKLANRVLKDSGSLVIAAPNHNVVNKIPGTVIPVIYIDNNNSNSANGYFTSRWKPLLLSGPGQKSKSKTLDALVCNNTPSSAITEAEYIIKQLTSERGDIVVLDPLMGPGATTGIAALNLGCKFIGIENNLKSFEIAKTKIEDRFKNKELHKIEGKTISIDKRTPLYYVENSGNEKPLLPDGIQGDIRDCYKLHTQLCEAGAVKSSRTGWTSWGNEAWQWQQ